MRRKTNPMWMMVWAGALAVGAMVMAKSLPDLRRYLRLRRM
ncbi:MAG: hypothetical protein DIU72_009520 [Pseudomonadota bacterium]